MSDARRHRRKVAGKSDKGETTQFTQRKMHPTNYNVYLRVNTRFLLKHNLPTAAQPDPPGMEFPEGTTSSLNIIVARLDELQVFAGDTVDWLHRIARLVLEPFGAGRLFTFGTKDVNYWLDHDKDDSWTPVQPGEVLRATIYEYRPGGLATLPTRICERHVRSVTTARTTAKGLASQFRAELLRRHPCCIISRQPRVNLIASHLIPRRLGDSGVQSIFRRFTNDLSTPITVYNKSMGVTLYTSLDTFVDLFEVGFWYMGNGRYEVHSFTSEVTLNLYGLVAMPEWPLPALHGAQIDVGDDPPSGVFDWHYLQCVLRKFATAAFRDMDNIRYYVTPFRTCEDADEDEDDTEFDDPQNPPYPSYFFDRACSRAYERWEDAQRQQDIDKWRSHVP